MTGHNAAEGTVLMGNPNAMLRGASMTKKERKFYGISYFSEEKSSEAQDATASAERQTKSAWLVLMSWVTCTLILGFALFSTPYMSEVAKGNAVESFGECLTGFVIGSIFCGWPWLLAFINSKAPERQVRTIAFSVVAMLIAAQFYWSVRGVPSEGVGLSLISAVLLIWAAYPLSRIFGR
ncbi:MAG: hypothetical protein K2X79_06000 [Burkholderiaceae bacterium]|nr:hypothetical protein [Burkholderiaceae bacterium]